MMKNIIFIILFLFCCLQVSAQDYLQLANNCFEKGDYECAKKNYALCQTFDGKDMSAQIQKADKCFKSLLVADDYFKGKEYEKARDRYKIVLEKNSKDLYAKRQYDECVRIIQTETILPISSNDPQEPIPAPSTYSPMSWYQEGVKNSNAGNYSEAIRCYRKALDLDPSLFDAWNGLADACFFQANYVEAIEYYKKVPENRRSITVWYNMGVCYKYLNQYENAIDCYKEVPKNSRSATVWNEMGICYKHLQEYDNAIDCFQNSNSIDNRGGTAWYNMGLCYADKKNLSKSIESLRKAAQIGHKEAQKLLDDMKVKWR